MQNFTTALEILVTLQDKNCNDVMLSWAPADSGASTASSPDAQKLASEAINDLAPRIKATVQSQMASSPKRNDEHLRVNYNIKIDVASSAIAVK